jgi:hypothetical protein
VRFAAPIALRPIAALASAPGTAPAAGLFAPMPSRLLTTLGASPESRSNGGRDAATR